MKFCSKNINLLIMSLFSLLVFIYCSGNGSTPESSATKVTIQGVAVLGRVADGKVTVYPMLADGTPDTQNPLGTSTTDSNGNYSVDTSQQDLQGGLGSVVVQLGSGTYTEEATGTSVTISPNSPINATLPIDPSVATATQPVSINATVSGLTNIAYQKNVNDCGSAMMTKAIAAGYIPAEFQAKALDFQKTGFDPSFLASNPDFKTAYEGARGNAHFQGSDFKTQISPFATNANFSVSTAFGVPSVIGSTPGDPKSGSTTPDQAAYMVAMPSMSQQASKAGVDSFAMMQAYGKNFAQQGNFNFSPSAGPIQVQGADGKQVSMAPPNFSDFTQNFSQIANGTITMPGITAIYAPQTGTGSGGPQTQPPSWFQAFTTTASQAGTFNAAPSGQAPPGWTPAGVILGSGSSQGGPSSGTSGYTF